MNKTNNILSTEDLTIGYKRNKGNHVVGKSISLALKKGEVVCLMGKNGIGKSTLLRSITGVQENLGGEVFLKEKSLRKFSLSQIAQTISLVLTDKIEPTNLTVFELVALGRHPYTNWLGTLSQKDEETIVFALSKTDLLSLKNTKVNELSDGQMQRVMICRALAQDTPIIILDEPTAHLDIQHKIETFQLLHSFAHELNKAILISTHEIQLSLQIADQLWLMDNQGITTGNVDELVKNGEINRIFDNPSIQFDHQTRLFKFINLKK
ncbi:ABC transporter ATP-binding protein [Namhaeicola litoreus]|uniref:ABC transporter ATP-binding protein n=1 Tax=Namhaeicola litoreus TaxID=1052145 RepID=A0ABW3Y2A3_9FLAO